MLVLHLGRSVSGVPQANPPQSDRNTGLRHRWQGEDSPPGGHIFARDVSRGAGGRSDIDFQKKVHVITQVLYRLHSPKRGLDNVWIRTQNTHTHEGYTISVLICGSIPFQGHGD